jgi:hypothetical protein
MMNSQVKFFLLLCQRYLEGQLSAHDYICAFEELYIASEVTLSEREFVVFDEIYTTNDRFEPDDKIRKADKYLIDETELHRLIQKGVNNLAA